MTASAGWPPPGLRTWRRPGRGRPSSWSAVSRAPGRSSAGSCPNGIARTIRSSAAAGPQSWRPGCGTCWRRACRWPWSSAGSVRRTGMVSRCWSRSGPSTLRRSGSPRVAGVTGKSARSIFDAITLGKIDHWATRPAQVPAEEFHRSITEFLREWSSRRDGGYEAVRAIGEPWSARSQELRDIFARYRVPAGFYAAASERAQQMLRELGLELPELAVVVLRFGAGRSALVNPTNLEIADAFGLMRPISPRRSSTWRWSAPTRPGSRPRSTRPPKACGSWWSSTRLSAGRRRPAR